MTVRFLPARSSAPLGAPTEREGLAEVVELRERLVERAAPESVEPSAPPLDRAVRLLARKALSMTELAIALRKEGYDESQVDETVRECVDRLYLDDLALAERIVEKTTSRKNIGRSALRRELKARHIADPVIDAVLLQTSDEVDADRMREAALDRARKLQTLERSVAERRLMAFLARRGFSGSRMSQVVREALDEVSSY